jgi:hypothetical protein
MSDACAERNQREAADHVRSAFEANNNLSAAIRALANFADWEADDPRSTCLNVANYLEGGNRSRPYTL